MSLARNVATVGSGTMLSRLLAYGRDAGIAALFGTTLFAEAFFAMLQVVNFFRRLLAEGALNSAFVPLWLKLRAGDNGAAAANRLTIKSLLAMFCITGVLTLVIIVFAWPLMHVIAPGFDTNRIALAGYLLMIAAPYVLLSGLVAVIAAALNAAGRVAAVAVSTVAFNVVMVAAVAFAFGTNAVSLEISIWLAAAIVVAGLLQFVIAVTAWLVSAKPWRGMQPRRTGQTAVFYRRALPGLIAAGIPQLKLIAATAIVSASPAAVSWLYYANRLYELPLGIASVAVSMVIVPRIAASLTAGDGAAFAATQSRAYEVALGLALPAAAGFAVLAEPIAGGLFQRGQFNAGDTAAVAAAVTAICAGLPGHVLEKVFGAVSFAHEDTRTPMFTALSGLAVAIAAGLLLFPRYGYVGAAAAIALSSWAGAGLLGIVLYRRGWLRLDAVAGRRLPRVVLATAVMAGIVAAALALTHVLFPAVDTSSLGRLTALAILVALGVAIYLATLQIAGVVRLKELASALRQKA